MPGRNTMGCQEKTSKTGSFNHLHAVEQIYTIPDSFPKGEFFVFCIA